MSNKVRLAKLDEVPVHGALGFDPFDEGRDSLFVVRNERGVFAYRDICPHYGSTTLPWRKNAYLDPAGSNVVCAAHGAKFEIHTGLCISGPCLGQSLIPVPIAVAEDGYLVASIDQKSPNWRK